MYSDNCVIYDNKICDECGDCNYCDINQNKICDNCGMCISEYDYSCIQIDRLYVDEKDNPARKKRRNVEDDCHDGCKHDHRS